MKKPVRTCSNVILMLSLMLSTIVLSPRLSAQSLKESTQESKFYTESEVREAIQVAVDYAVPRAVQAAVAEKEAQIAELQESVKVANSKILTTAIKTSSATALILTVLYTLLGR